MAGIVLIGYRGTGKTTVGKILAQRLSIPFIDSDRLLEMRAGKTIATIFAEEGEPAFRALESEIIAGLADRTDLFVLATGGGVPVREENRRNLRRIADAQGGKGRVIWLTATPATIVAHMANDPSNAQTRPALTDLSPLKEIESLLTVREPFYRQTADDILPIDHSTPEELADQILSLLQ